MENEESYEKIFDMDEAELDAELVKMGYDPEKICESFKLSPLAIKVIEALNKKINLLKAANVSQAVEFAEWIIQNKDYDYCGKGEWQYDESNKVVTTSELHEIFKSKRKNP